MVKLKLSLVLTVLFLLFVDINAKKVQGIIINLKTNRPIPNVVVSLLSEDNVITAVRVSDSNGYFGFDGVKLGKFFINTIRAGYVNIHEGPFNISRRDSINFLIKLEEQSYILDEIVITDKRVERLLNEVGFNFRKEIGNGKFYTREDLQEKNYFNLISLMRTIPGIMVTDKNGLYNIRTLRGIGASVLNNGFPSIYIDGVLIDDEMSGFFDIFNINDVAGIEVYNSYLDAPAQYSRGNPAGVILIWTGKF